jgi:uncharacterized SAM-binding protein YcdF (DUF218 family)
MTEAIHNPETPLPSPALLIVLGKNIGVDSSPEDIRRDNYHLSRESRLNALAAGNLYRPGMKILFSTGGEGVPAESSAMRDYLLSRFPDIPEEAIDLEDRSIDTAGNAEEVSKILRNEGELPESIGLFNSWLSCAGRQKAF